MSSPTHENIDQWLFDRIEGNLSLEQEQELSLFLLLNPTYDIDLDAWEKRRLEIEEEERQEQLEKQLKQKQMVKLVTASIIGLFLMVFLFKSCSNNTNNSIFILFYIN